MRGRRSWIITLVLFSLLIPKAIFAEGLEGLKEDSSLSWIPADTSFYASSQRGEEQWNRVANSKAIRRLKTLFAVQAGIAFLKTSLDNEDIKDEVDQARSLWAQAKDLGIPDLLRDGWRNEIFVHGNQEWGAWVSLTAQAFRDIQQSQMQLIGSDDIEADTDELISSVIREAAIDAAGLDIPRLTIGMRLSDAAAAERIVNQAGAWLEEKVDDPGISLKLSKGDSPAFVEIVVTGNELPWSKWLRDADSDKEKRAVKAFEKALDEKKLQFTMGVHENQWLLTIGPELESLADLTSSDGKLLYDKDEMKRVRAVADKPITGVSYVSHEFMQAVSRPGESIDNLASMAQAGLDASDLAEEEPEIAEELSKDIREFAKDMKAWAPAPGTVVAVEWMHDTGYESFIQNWAENLYLDGSKKLDILRQAGKDPVLLMATRTKRKGETYQLLTKWVRRGEEWLQRALEREDMPEDGRETINTVLPVVNRCMNRFDEITSNELIASLDGQSAVVVNDQLTSRSWIPLLPESHDMLKLPELAVLYPLKDGKLFRKAIDNYSEWGQETMNEVRETVAAELAKAEQSVKDAKGDGAKDKAKEKRDQWQKAQDELDTLPLPNAEERDFAKGQLYAIPISEVWVDEKIAPSLAVAENTAVLATAPETAKRLATESAAPAEGFVAENLDRPLAAAVIVQPARITELLREWSEYGFKTAVEMTEQNELNMFSGQVDTILEVLGCCRRLESITFVEDESLVTHSRSHFEDL